MRHPVVYIIIECEQPRLVKGNLTDVSCIFIWENRTNRVSTFLFLPHGGNGAAITKKIEQKDRKLVLPVEEISIS